jgi:hypothetical protein
LKEPVWKGATNALWANVVQPLLERRRAVEEDVAPPPEGEKPLDNVYLDDLLQGFQGTGD